MQIENNYNNAYKGTYSAQKSVTSKHSYAIGTATPQTRMSSSEQSVYKKDTFVKYEFNTTDKCIFR